MVIFGGLEFVAAGYLYHRYNKSQKEKKKQEADIRTGRPGQSCPRRQRQYHQQVQCRPSPQKYHTYAYTHTHTASGQQRPIEHQPQPQQQYTGRPQPYIHQHTQSHGHFAAPHTAHTFPLQQLHSQHQQPQPPPHVYAQAHQQPPPMILPPRRSDSTASQPPMANGIPPSDLWLDHPSQFQHQGDSAHMLALQGPHHPYGQPGFSASLPSLADSTVYTPSQRDDQLARVRYAAQVRRSVDGEPEGEDDPPPPYRP